jgi:gas vesicle protein
MSDSDDFGAFLIGFMVGGVAGAVVALLFAPQSGEETRTLIKDKSIELREKAGETADKARVEVDRITAEAKERGTEFVEGAKKAVAKKKPASTSS